jgi:uncharacterized membrane protein YedE/YeeE
MIVGAAVQSRVSGQFRWEGFRDAGDTGAHIVGATLMGIGGVTALGCTIGQGLSGLSTLSLTSFVALAAIIAGAIAGVRFQAWRLERAAEQPAVRAAVATKAAASTPPAAPTKPAVGMKAAASAASAQAASAAAHAGERP